MNKERKCEVSQKKDLNLCFTVYISLFVKVFFSFECSISRITSCLQIDLDSYSKALNHASKCLDPLNPADSFNPTL